MTARWFATTVRSAQGETTPVTRRLDLRDRTHAVACAMRMGAA
ncbi:hypothetical protein [Streptomyces sp. NPDC002265]